MKNLLLVSIVGAFIVGCQAMPYKPYARKVQYKPRKGGIVALKLDHRNEDRLKAEGIMKQACAKTDFEVLEEGEVVIGSITNATEKDDQGASGVKMGSLFGIPVTSGGRDASKKTSSTTTQKKEWQIKFKCLRVAGKGSRKSSVR